MQLKARKMRNAPTMMAARTILIDCQLLEGDLFSIGELPSSVGGPSAIVTVTVTVIAIVIVTIAEETRR